MLKKSLIVTATTLVAGLLSLNSFALDMPNAADLKDAATELLTGKDGDAVEATADAAEAATDTAAVVEDAAVETAATEGEVATDNGFAALDTNTDGVISMDEAQASESDLTDHWAAADTNSDGQLDASEFSAFELGEMPAAVEEAAPAH
ncbi:MAG: hypothetical protein V3W04_12565 [Gammaproteobacteria bacterium]